MDPLTSSPKLIGMSPYSAMANNPVTYIDPDGRCFQKVGDEYVPCEDAKVGSTTTGAFDNNWTMTKNDGWQLTNGAGSSTVNYEYDYIEPTGDASYYVDRYKNHIEKYNTRPPDYYLGYGYNNKVRFDKTRPTMTKVGKEVFDKIGFGLQNTMNDGIRDNPSLQSDNTVFKSFAYNTHLPVYKKSGIGKLKGDDLLRMIRTPKWGDTFGSPEGRSLILKLFPHLFQGPSYPKGYWNPQKNPGILKAWEPK